MESTQGRDIERSRLLSHYSQDDINLLVSIYSEHELKENLAGSPVKRWRISYSFFFLLYFSFFSLFLGFFSRQSKKKNFNVFCTCRMEGGERNCINGWCGEDGTCNCNPCWSGSTCQEYGKNLKLATHLCTTSCTCYLHTTSHQPHPQCPYTLYSYLLLDLHT